MNLQVIPIQASDAGLRAGRFPPTPPACYRASLAATRTEELGPAPLATYGSARTLGYATPS